MFDNLRRTAALYRNGDRIRAQLVPDDEVVIDLPEAFLHDALAAAGVGLFGPAADLLAALRLRGDWAARSQAVAHLARRASIFPTWLEDWRRADPHCPDQLLVRATCMILEAWNVRGDGRAILLEEDQVRAFLALLDDATAVLKVAMAAAPEDPEPWAQVLVLAKGLDAHAIDFDACRATLVDIDPDHFLGHRSALIYLTPKHHGSREAMFQYAEQASAGRPATSRLHTLPLVAFTEYLFDPTDRDRTEWMSYRDGAVERATAWIESIDTADPAGVAETRNMLAWVHLAQKEFAPAHAQFIAIGARAASYPWHYFGDARTEFLSLRNVVATHIAAGHR
ncbi:hypothetical protein [Nocardioides ochotonae]|uniref:hypothetical protein n=1 Tax=Nocardioides ochotonae TaxID=2685869 RepID=UPI00140A203E|nr:hypothetical protein [Nocardioides ochotonae]